MLTLLHYTQKIPHSIEEKLFKSTSPQISYTMWCSWDFLRLHLNWNFTTYSIPNKIYVRSCVCAVIRKFENVKFIISFSKSNSTFACMHSVSVCNQRRVVNIEDETFCINWSELQVLEIGHERAKGIA